MTQIGNVPEIIAVKKHLDHLKERGLVQAWEVPYENILTRLTAACFFISPTEDSKLEEIWSELRTYPNFHFRLNEPKKISQFEWRVEFNNGLQ